MLSWCLLPLPRIAINGFVLAGRAVKNKELHQNYSCLAFFFQTLVHMFLSDVFFRLFQSVSFASPGAWNQIRDPNISWCPKSPQIHLEGQKRLAEDVSEESSRKAKCRQELRNAADPGDGHKRAILGEWDSLDWMDSWWYRMAFKLRPFLTRTQVLELGPRDRSLLWSVLVCPGLSFPQAFP